MKNWKSPIFVWAISIGFGFGVYLVCILINFTFSTLNLPDFPYLFLRTLYPDDFKETEPQVLRTILKGDDALELLWSQSGIHTTKSSHTFAGAANGVLFYIASKKYSISQEIVAVDAKDGVTVLWRTHGPGTTSPVVLYSNSSALYVGGNGKVAAYDLQTGTELWSKSFPSQRTVTDLQVADSLVYVKAVSSFQALLQANSGQEIKDWDSVSGFSQAYFENKTLTLDTEFGNGPGIIYAKDRQTEQILWEAQALSNAVVSKTAVYFIVENNELQLRGAEPRSGEIVTSVTFEPDTSPDYLKLYDFPHRLALDKELGLLYVFLRDSGQLFAFKIVNFAGS